MVWIVMGGVVVAVGVVDWLSSGRLKKRIAGGEKFKRAHHDPTQDTNANYHIVDASARSVRDQSGGAFF